MRTEITINGSANASERYISWSPSPAQVRLADAEGATTPVQVRLRNQNTTQGGQVLFFAARAGAGLNELQLSLPVNGSPVDFFVAGQFPRASTADRDATIEVVDVGTGSTLSVTPLMVRIRKNANLLTPAERDRFVSAFATLNDRGMGQFRDFRDMHRNVADDEEHGRAGFLPWHRSYLLDLERELQRIDPSVALHYWRFDQAAPQIFSKDFLGVPDTNGTLTFNPANPLQFWATDLTPGIVRQALFNTNTQPANDGTASGRVISEQATLRLGGTNKTYRLFSRMEGQPHGTAHVSFDESSYISDIDTAPKDPLFFLLHCNVDRLWAKWQRVFRRFDPTSARTYNFLGSAGSPGATRIGHNLKDTMWPWNQITTNPRPNTAPGGNFPGSLITGAPGATPAVLNMIDYQGVLNPSSRLGFDYDDVPFQF